MARFTKSVELSTRALKIISLFCLILYSPDSDFFKRSQTKSVTDEKNGNIQEG